MNLAVFTLPKPDGKLKHEIKSLWLTDLRSGKFKQGTQSLHTMNESYCCYGVLARRAVQAGVVTREEQGSVYSYDGDASLLTPTVGKWATGFDQSELYNWNPSVKFDGRMIELSVLNDDEQLTFDEIADLIDAQL